VHKQKPTRVVCVNKHRQKWYTQTYVKNSVYLYIYTARTLNTPSCSDCLSHRLHRKTDSKKHDNVVLLRVASERAISISICTHKAHTRPIMHPVICPSRQTAGSRQLRVASQVGEESYLGEPSELRSANGLAARHDKSVISQMR